MKHLTRRARRFRLMPAFTASALAVITSASALLSGPALAETNKSATEISTASEQQEATVSLTQAELEQMLAPVALYPDTLLTHILIASTYPLEVVQAARWARANRDLAGEAAVNAVADKDWDPSVKALVAFPQILGRMSEELDWTQTVGEAFLADEAEVMERIQALRQQAYDAGNLDGLEHIKVEREERTIIIEPAVREVVYVPYYDTRVVYGDWRWHQYPPMYWEMPSHHVRWSSRSGTQIYWSTGVRLPSSFYFSSFHWPQRQVVVVHRYDPYPWFYSSRQISRHRDAHPWRHNPHRRSTGYHGDRRDDDHNWRRHDGRRDGYGPGWRPGGQRVGSPPTPPRVAEPQRPSGPRYIPGRPQSHPSNDIRTPPRGRAGEARAQPQRRAMPERDVQVPGGATQHHPAPRASNNPQGRPQASGGASHKRHPVRGGN